MKYIVAALLLLTVLGCSDWQGICQGTQPGQFYLVENTNFILFHRNHVLELRQILEGPDKGKMVYVRKAYPASLESRASLVAPEDAEKKKKPEEKQEEQGGW